MLSSNSYTSKSKNSIHRNYNSINEATESFQINFIDYSIPGTKALSAALLFKLFVETFLSRRVQFLDEGPGAVVKLFKVFLSIIVGNGGNDGITGLSSIESS